ncbi:hypothetical protein VSR01_16440 [Actinacidiphila sp. DG2A-62]|uniref:hypothetical protein n=1 Tax=Actinacidiphila sp. DG2A-62 TaxID=3108821 RepID=UPI002DB66B9B|nr:hypothetical protein [Actinacidiphila sp. DG2A-62]MEC3995035.1 hypothetical protein [Actinacidiphila sp. DG2A-62]
MSTENAEEAPAAYAPSEQLQDALKELGKAEEAVAAARTAVRAAIAADLRAFPSVTTDEMAAHVPYSNETVRGIAREYDVPRKRKPTVRSIAEPEKKS